MIIKTFDEHHEVLLFWEEYKNLLPKTVLHVDYHADMWAPGNPIDYEFSCVPGYTNISIYNSDIRRVVEECLSPTSFLIPAILRYRFEKLYFLKPTGSRLKYSNPIIGTIEGKGQFIRIVNELNKSVFPDSICYEHYEIENLEKFPDEDYILDIDLDYFCCNMNPNIDDDLFIDICGDLKNKIDQVNYSSDMYNINLNIVPIHNNRFYFINHSKLNHIYNENLEWIKYSIDLLVSCLKQKPRYVSICRSVKTGYTPLNVYKFIEDYLINQLKQWDVKPIYPINEKLFLSEYTLKIDNVLYNYITETFVPLDTIGLNIWNLLSEESYSVFQIVDIIKDSYQMDYNELLSDVKTKIDKYRRYLIVK